MATKESEDHRGGAGSSALPSSLGVESPRSPRSGSPAQTPVSGHLAPPSPRLAPAALSRRESDFMTPRLGSHGNKPS